MPEILHIPYIFFIDLSYTDAIVTDNNEDRKKIVVKHTSKRKRNDEEIRTCGHNHRNLYPL